MDITIIGAGIGGLTAAQALLQQGHTVRVLEAAPALREVGAGVVLGANAMQALDRLGLHAAVRAQGEVVARLALLDRHGRVLNAADPTPFTRRLGYDNLAIHRAALQGVLLAALPAGTVQLGGAFARFTAGAQTVTVHGADGRSIETEALVGADGLRSAVRGQVLPNSCPRYAGYTCWRGVVDGRGLGLPVGHSAELWGGRAGRFGYVPLASGQVYWFACLNSPVPDHPALRAYTVDDLRRKFRPLPAPVDALLARTPPEQLLWNDIFDVKPLKRFAFGRVLLLGDAAHATTPNLGQGAGQAVEDAPALAACLARFPGDVSAAFAAQRRPRTTQIVEQSWRLGQAAQLESPWLTALRDAVMRRVPPRFTQRQLAFLYQTNPAE